MGDEVEKPKEAEARPLVDQQQPREAVSPSKDSKAEKQTKKERVLKVLLVLVLIFLGYEIFHWFEVVKEVKDPNSLNARPDRIRIKHMTEAELEEAEKLVRPK